MKSSNEVKSYHIGLWQTRAFRALQALTTEYLEPTKISPVEWALLGVLYDQNSNALSQKELAKELGTSEPFIAKTIKKLIEQGFVTKQTDTQDARFFQVCITDDGKKFLDTHELPLRKYLRDNLEFPTGSELNGYLTTIKSMAKKESTNH